MAERLYAAAPDRFVTLRSEAVQQARAAKDKALVAAIGALRRPTRTAWLVNLLARSAGDDLERLLALGGALAEAQRSRAGDELRRLSAERRHAVDALTARAVELGREQGYEATDTVRQEVSQTLQAALADGEVTDQVRRGVLTQARTYGGFGPFDLAPAAAGGPGPAPGPAPVPTGPDDGPALRKARDRARTAAAAHAAAEERHAEAERAAAAATQQADALADRADALRVELAEAEAAEQAARHAARAARKRLDDAERAREAARSDAETAATELRDVEHR